MSRRSLEAAEALHRAALALLPRGFRARFGDEVADAFRDGARGALRSGGRRALAAWTARCVADALVDAARLRLPGTRGGAGGARPGGPAGPRGAPAGGGAGLDGLLRDLRDAWRGAVRPRSTFVVAVLTLALGVGANAAIFSAVNGVLLRPFDLPQADRLVVLEDRSLDGGAPFRTTGGAYRDWKAGNRTLSGVALMGGATLTFTEPGLDPERVDGLVVSHDWFDVVGVRPALGRAFTEAETRGSPRVVVLSDAVWRERYGADPDVVGGTVTVEGEAWRVVGVMPPVGLPSLALDVSMEPADARRVWIPLDFEREWVDGYRSHIYAALGRLRHGVTVEAAGADMASITAGIRERQADLYTGLDSDVRALRDVVLGDVRGDLWVLLGAVGIVLLVACANLANLLLARSVDRARERAVRSALGAGGGRLLRLGLLEAAIPGIVGGALGLVAAVAGVDALVALLPDDVPRRGGIRVDGVVMAFTVATSLAAALAAGLVPALRGARPALGASLKGAGRSTSGPAGHRLTRGLVASQLALACSLLVGAGLLVRSFQALRSQELGATTASTLDAEIVLPRGRYATREATLEVLRRLEETVEAVPGVTAAAVAYDPPVSGSWTESFEVADRPPPGPGERPGSYFRPVSPGYLEQMGVRVVRGRGFEPGDDASAPGVTLVNEAFVRTFFAGEEDRVLGRRIRMGTMRGMWGEGPGEWEIVGVVSDVRFRGLRRSAPDAFYFSTRQAPTSFVHLLARTAGDPEDAVAGVRAAVRSVDAEVPLSAVTTLDAARARLTAQDRLNALLLAAFSLVALLVAAAGVYGVLSHAAARRVPEMGVRLALGARPAAVERLLLGEGLRMAAAGLALGVAGALVVGRLLAGLLYGVAPWDPAVLGGVVALLLATSVAAGWLPARRASGTDPAVALRAE